MTAPERPRRLRRPRRGARPGSVARPFASVDRVEPAGRRLAPGGRATPAAPRTRGWRGGTRSILAALSVALLLLAACGDAGPGPGTDPTGDERSAGTTGATDGQRDSPTTTALGPTGPIDQADLLTAAGDAPAARGAGLDDPPGDPERTPLEGFAETAAAVTAPDGTVTGWCLLLALTAQQRQRGLMEVTDLGGYAGMLFVWPEDTSSGFYMRNTPTPLSIGWMDAEGELVSTADMEPCADVDGCPTYSPAGSYRFALEVPQGRLAELGVVEGSRLAVGGECAPRPPS